MEESNEYTKLQGVLDLAYAQASSGKGKERHANENPFENQPICQISRLLKDSTGEQAAVKFQAIKKTIEAGRLEKDAAVRELLGAINYLSAAIIMLQE